MYIYMYISVAFLDQAFKAHLQLAQLFQHAASRYIEVSVCMCVCVCVSALAGCLGLSSLQHIYIYIYIYVINVYLTLFNTI